MPACKAEVVFEPASADAVVDVVFVHGLLGQRKPWTHGSGNDSVFWPKAIFGPRVGRARIITFNYDAKPEYFWATEADTRLDEISDELLWELRSIRDSKTTERPVIIVAHSIGGLVAQNALLRGLGQGGDHKKLVTQVRRLALLGTPFSTQPASWAAIGEKFKQLLGPSTRSSRSEQIDEQSLEKLARVGREFDEFLKKNQREDSLQVVCFFEGLETRVSSLSDSSRSYRFLIADEAGVKIPSCPGLPYKVRASHQGMAEVSKEDDEHYRPVRRVIEAWVKTFVTNANARRAEGNAYNASFGSGNRGFQIGHQFGGHLSGISFSTNMASVE